MVLRNTKLLFQSLPRSMHGHCNVCLITNFLLAIMSAFSGLNYTVCLVTSLLHQRRPSSHMSHDGVTILLHFWLRQWLSGSLCMQMTSKDHQLTVKTKCNIAQQSSNPKLTHLVTQLGWYSAYWQLCETLGHSIPNQQMVCTFDFSFFFSTFSRRMYIMKWIAHAVFSWYCKQNHICTRFPWFITIFLNFLQN